MLDERIVDLYWARSEDAIAETSKKYGKLCHSIAYNILKSHEDAEECVSDTYLRAWSSMPEARPNKLMAYLGKITRNLALNRYRHNTSKGRSTGQMELALEELSECVSGSDSTEEVVDRMIFHDTLNLFLMRQSPRNRDVFIARYWFLHSAREIAEMYGVSEGSVNTSLHRMRRELKEILEKEEILL